MKTTLITAAAGLLLVCSPAAFAASPEQAELLKSKLTPMGAERAGNKDGSIPAWDGGYTKLPAGFKNGDHMPDPFAAEKPLFSITAANAAQYKDKLPEGAMQMFKAYPNYRIDVYKTHRTASAPQWVYDNIQKNATRVKPHSAGIKFGFTDGYGGIPFPIPDADPALAGAQIMWNHNMRWEGPECTRDITAWVVNSSGTRTLSSGYRNTSDSPYYDPKGSLETYKGYKGRYRIDYVAPPSSNGQALLQWQSSNTKENNTQTWQYLTGQGRVRKAPSLLYDTPAVETSGLTNYDEYFVFTNNLDRYDWKLVGKKEMFVPYNNNKLVLSSPEQAIGPQFLNPDLVRWELHRVWVVEATLAPGQRHTVPRKVFYHDEDTWHAVLSDAWDARDQYWRFSMMLSEVRPDAPGLLYTNSVSYNIQQKEYAVVGGSFNGGDYAKYVSYTQVDKPDSFYDPNTLARDSTR